MGGIKSCGSQRKAGAGLGDLFHILQCNSPYLRDAPFVVATTIVLIVGAVTAALWRGRPVRVDEADVDDAVEVGVRELCRVLVDGVYGDVRVLQTEALLLVAHPRHARLGDVELARAQRLVVHVDRRAGLGVLDAVLRGTQAGEDDHVLLCEPAVKKYLYFKNVLI